MSHMKISERVHFGQAVTPQDINAAAVTSPYFSMAGVGRVLVQATTAALAAGKKITLQLMQAQDAIGTGAKTLGSSVDVVMASGGAAFGQVEATAATMDKDNGFTYVAVTLSTNNAVTVNGAAILVFGDLSFRP